ncbi:leucyl aminopeptidase [Saliniramus sp.]|uniref:leucyl aminopeptidase n=1 Tax=Saliniramus sp. TaxID=2986772 RepID=UPI002C571436|nr:leucyl aminopeptidase [Saliniramus sp.]HMB09615.1 leucyl aminopeptidase [Saliniramus sp.]
MSDGFKLDFESLQIPASGDLVLCVGEDLAPGPQAARLLGDSVGIIARAAKAEKFKGKFKSLMTITAPGQLDVDRLVIVGLGKPVEAETPDWPALGAAIAGATAGREAMLVTEFPGFQGDDAAISGLALGARLRAYRFDHYKSKKKDDDDDAPKKGGRLTLAGADPQALKKAAKQSAGLADGVMLARDLVNEPANTLGPVEFAERAAALEKLGVEVEILDEKQLGKIGMRALLGVAQGSERPARVAIMHWQGAKKSEKPVAFIGKGVVFDTGGISIKPAGGMEDMKGDMAGAATVVGLMHALAARKAKANVIGAIGLVENMPDGKAQRPGDIVETLSGQTVEIINTDAEGRLVLADLLSYVEDTYEPQFMIDLATLTGAIIVALGKDHAGLFSNDDALCEKLGEAGGATGEKVWRLPLGKAYDKLIDSKFADMKNTGGRYGGAITAAQFLQRFVKNTPWAHLDIAGTGMAAEASDVNKSWGSGFGVRLLDRLVTDHYES